MKIPSLTEKEQEALLKRPLIAKLATFNKDGSIRITPLWFEVRGKSIVFNTHEKTTHVGNLKRNSRATVVIDTQEQPYSGVHMVGKAKVDTKPSTKEEIGKMFTRYIGDYKKAEAYGSMLISWGKRVFVTFEPEKTTTWDFGKA